jgi:hypothetical protein
MGSPRWGQRFEANLTGNRLSGIRPEIRRFGRRGRLTAGRGGGVYVFDARDLHCVDGNRVR